MIETLTESFTTFDAIAVLVIVLSAIMALARGFMRELATLGAFIAALAVAFYANRFFSARVGEFLPAQTADWVATMIVVVIAFLVVYVSVTWIGNRLSSTIQGLEGVTSVDRLAGFVFGAARGLIAMTFFVLLLNNSLSNDKVPEWIANGASYPFFERAASIVNSNAPRIADESDDVLETTHLTGYPDRS